MCVHHWVARATTAYARMLFRTGMCLSLWQLARVGKGWFRPKRWYVPSTKRQNARRYVVGRRSNSIYSAQRLALFHPQLPHSSAADDCNANVMCAAIHKQRHHAHTHTHTYQPVKYNQLIIFYMSFRETLVMPIVVINFKSEMQAFSVLSMLYLAAALLAFARLTLDLLQAKSLYTSDAVVAAVACDDDNFMCALTR